MITSNFKQNKQNKNIFIGAGAVIFEIKTSF